ncbi:MAG: Lrp/AsnC ligand binding domain-containing protein [Nitrososphaeraceae archaeon]|nr:Lrp/AsnC ligand binding domain-containing protein [Nitrososphaeraceae archaeon]
MIKAYILIICEPGHKYEIAKHLKKIENVVNVDIVNGAYDLILEALFETMEDMRERFQNEIKQIDRLMSTLTLVASEST